jgi:hypothetical protein
MRAFLRMLSEMRGVAWRQGRKVELKSVQFRRSSHHGGSGFKETAD